MSELTYLFSYILDNLSFLKRGTLDCPLLAYIGKYVRVEEEFFKNERMAFKEYNLLPVAI